MYEVQIYYKLSIYLLLKHCLQILKHRLSDLQNLIREKNAQEDKAEFHFVIETLEKDFWSYSR